MNRKFLFVLIAATVGALALFALGCEMCCNSSQGHGSIVIADPNAGASHTASFRYRVKCVGSYAETEDAVRKVSGRLQYQDNGPWTNPTTGRVLNVSFEAGIDNVVSTSEVGYEYYFDPRPAADYEYYKDFLPLPAFGSGEYNAVEGVYCSQTVRGLALFRGKYTPRPESLGEGGVVTIMAMDDGKAGPSADDRFEIRIDSGVFQGYWQRGVLAKGGIRSF